MNSVIGVYIVYGFVIYTVQGTAIICKINYVQNSHESSTDPFNRTDFPPIHVDQMNNTLDKYISFLQRRFLSKQTEPTLCIPFSKGF